MARTNLDKNQIAHDFFGRFVFYYGKFEPDERNIGLWASSDHVVYIGIVLSLWAFRVSFWIQRDKL